MDSTPAVVAATPARPTLGDWFRANAGQLAGLAAVVALVCYYLHPLDVLIAGFGMSLIIIVHELGHFAAAKWFDVHVRTFSIGIGPALPFCRYKYGETTYKLAVLPIGGFVYMVGEGDDGNDVNMDEPDRPTAAEDAADPRSLRNKPVWQRMVIISAGVVMNLLLAAVCFVATYLHGVDERPGVIARVEPGGAAWRAGVHAGSEIVRIDGRVNPWFDDIKPIIQSTDRGEVVDLVTRFRGEEVAHAVEPVRAEGSLFPMMGVNPVESMTLFAARRDPLPPVRPGSPAARAEQFRGGDTVVAMTDPDAPDRAVTPLDAKRFGPGAFFDYHRRLVRLAEEPVEVHVVRKGDSSGTPVPVRLDPAPFYDLGVRMRTGPVVAVRRNSPAERAGVQVQDRVVSVTALDAAGKGTRFTTDPADLAGPDGGVLVDPVKLPAELTRWAARQTGPKRVRVTVLRAGDHTPARLSLDLDWDDTFVNEPVGGILPGTPVAVDGLGLAYQVLAVVDRVDPNTPAHAAGLKPDDKVTAVKYKAVGPDGKPVAQKWAAIKPHQWHFVWAQVQETAPHGLELKLERDGREVVADLSGVPDPAWGRVDRGLIFAEEKRTQKAAGIGEALTMGLYRTGRAVRTTYQSLYATVFGRISVMALSGPLTMAQNSYLIAGQDVWHLLIYMALISVNLAVVNFLPVPFLDGGHMVFLAYEGVRGKPAPVAVQNVLTIAGLALIVGLMLFVLALDVWRLFFR